jgi:hypothetical protein
MAAHEVAQQVRHPFYIGPDVPCAPHLPIGSPERKVLFAELRKTFAEDWAEAEEAVRREWQEKAGDLYFITAGTAVKIGRTNDLRARLKHIQMHNHEKVACAALVKGGGWMEPAYHRRFKIHRLHGEWFERVPEIEVEIERLNAPLGRECKEEG